MAELGATVIAFVSLAKLVQPLYNACSTIHGAPRDFQFFHNQLGSLRFVVAELGRLQDKFPADLISDKIADALSGCEKPFLDDIALLEKLLQNLETRASDTAIRISGWGRIKFLFKSGEFKQLAQRIGTYRDSLNTILLFVNSQYLPQHHDLLIKTYSATTRVESLMATHYSTMEPNRKNPTLVTTWKSSGHADSLVHKLQTNFQNLQLQQQANFDAFTSQIAAMDSIMAEISRTTTQGMTYSSSGPRIDFQSFKRLEFNFFFGSVVVSWGPLRHHVKKSILDDFDEEFGPGSQSAAQPLGSAVAVEIVPVAWISRRAVIGSLNMTRDQRCSPKISPGLSFPLTVQATAEVMSYAALGDIDGLKSLFNDRQASVTDRLDGGWTPLHVAVAAGQTLTCKFLLGHSADVTVTGRVGLTPLHLAAAYGHTDIIKLLVKHDSDPEAYNQHGFNAMFEALHSPFIADRNDKASIIKYILRQEHFVVNVNSQDYQGNSMLGWFAQHHPEGVKLLIDHDAEVNSRAYDGATPLHRAAARGSLDSVKLLMQAGAETTVIENDGSTALVQAASGGYLDIVRQLTCCSSQDDLVAESYKPFQLHCEPGMPGPSDVVNQIIRTCSHLKKDDPQRDLEICQAAQQGYWAVVSTLQEAGVDPYKKDEYGYRALVRLVYKEDLRRVDELIKSERKSMVPDDDLAMALVRAAAAGHGEVLTYLLSITEPGFFENAVGSKALVAAAKFGRAEFVQLLMPYVPQHCWYRALVRGAENGHIDVVNLFLNKGIHPTREGAGGDTAIVRAARYGHLDVVQRLLEAGADLDQHGWFGYSALVRASYNGFLEVVDCLLNAGASPDLAEIDGDTAMVRSIRQGHINVVDRLLKAGACPVDDTREVDGPSKALMKAAIYNDQDNLLRLLEDGADPNIIEPDGNTSLSRACENGHMNIVSTLLEWDARVTHPSKAAVSPLGRAAERGHSAIVNMLLASNSLKIPVPEKCKAMLKASENGFADIATSILDDGIDLQKQSMDTKSIGLVHFSILNHWMLSVVPDKQSLTALSPPLDVDNKTKLPYARGPPTWGFDGFLVARFRAPFKITFTSDLTSSRVRYMWSLVLLKARYTLELMRRFSFSLAAVIVLILGVGLLSVEYVFRAMMSI